MAKYDIGESVRFKAPELLVSTGGYSFKIGTDGLVGRVTGSVWTNGEETKYYVDVKLPRSLSESVSCILGILYSSDVTLKLTALESQIQSEKEHLDAKKHLRITTEVSELLKKLEDEHKHVIYPLSSIKARLNNPFFSVDLGVAGGDKSAASVVDKKMSKSRCVKLLESYRAEREKVKKGRKFERCLRDSVVDEALERAIELLKGGTE